MILTPQIKRQRHSRSLTIPAPVKGWNASAPLADMDPRSAVELINIFPEQRSVRLRSGHTQFATGMGTSNIESLMAWRGPSGGELKAAVGTNIYDVTNAGAVGAAEVSSLTNAKWQHCNFTTSGGNFLVCCNGADAVRNFDGANWTTPTINNVSSATLVHVAPHKRRLWFVQKDTTKAWYLGTEAIAGDAAAFDFGPQWSEGGYLQAIGSWTMDSGVGPDDFLVALSSEGQAAVYRGTDPASATTWAIVGVYNLPRPLGRRCMASFGGDLAIITEAGVISMNRALKADESQAYGAAYTEQIEDAFADAAQIHGAKFGWQFLPYPKGRMAILNVPVHALNTHQYVANTLTGAWCKFTGQPAFCWEVSEGRLFFGSKGVVYRADDGKSDAGAAINWQVRTAFNDFGSQTRIKHFQLVRPVIEVSGDIVPAIMINTNYRDTSPSGQVSFISGGSARWDEVRWNEFLWGGAGRVKSRWHNAGGEGSVGSVNMRGQALNNDLRIMQFDVVYQIGDYL